MKKRMQKIVLVLFMVGTLSIPTVESKAAVITSNATDKTAVVFDENTIYNAGDYTLYDGELYICTSDALGTWDTVQEHFLQVTKNHELGQSDDLSAEYQFEEDPSDEKSLMAFVANAWQKLKDFMGINNRTAATDKEGYTEAPVSAKLNYLKTQNEGLETQNNGLDEKFSALQQKVNDSFISVSSGKSILANAITDKGIDVSSSATFEQFKNSILALCDKEREAGKQSGLQESDGRVNKDSKSYAAGVEDADNRVNTNSESYKKGKADSEIKEYTSDITFSCDDGPTEALSSGESLTYYHPGSYQKVWIYSKSLPGHKILYAQVIDDIQENGMSAASTKVAILTGSTYSVIKSGSNSYALGTMSVSQTNLRIDGYVFNPTYANGSQAHLQVQIFYI